MKKASTFYLPVMSWLVLSVFLLGSMFTAQTAEAAAGPCTLLDDHHGVITADETWCASTASTHYMTDHVIVQAGATLTIEPGVTVTGVKNRQERYLIIQGHLEIPGTAAHPVILTDGIFDLGSGLYQQYWGGLYFDGSAGDGSGNISYANIEYAGSPWPPNLDITLQAGTAVYVRHLSTGKQVNISHSTIRYNVSQGLYVDDSTVNVTQTTFSQQQYPISIEGAASVVTYSGNTFSDNVNPYYSPGNVILIAPDALMGHDFSLPAQTGLDAYVFESGTILPVGRTMTVQPGVTVRTGSGNMFLIVQGRLDAIGTPALPIRFTGVRTPDTLMHAWGGLIFDGPSGASGHLDHTIVENGCGNWNGDCATLMIYNLAADKSVVVEHSLVQDSSSTVLAVINSPTAQVNGNLIKGGRWGVYLATNMTVSNLAVIDQVLDGVYVETGYSVDARHLTIARAGRSGFFVNTGGTGLLKNSILSHNVLAVKAEGTGQATLDTNLADTNTTFKSGAVTELHTITGLAVFAADGYHILTASDAVGVGLTGLSTTDMDGNARPAPAGSRPDLGADEILAGRFRISMPMLKR